MLTFPGRDPFRLVMGFMSATAICLDAVEEDLCLDLKRGGGEEKSKGQKKRSNLGPPK